jgi:hypothetical protein
VNVHSMEQARPASMESVLSPTTSPFATPAGPVAPGGLRRVPPWVRAGANKRVARQTARLTFHTLCLMDPRNIAHDKTVAQEKKQRGTAAAAGAPHDQPGKKEKKKRKPAAGNESAQPANEVIPVQPAPKGPPPELEGSLVVLAQLKDLAFHANAHQGRLAEMMLTVEEKLKQKDFANTVGEIYSAQAAVHDKLTELIGKYAEECERMQGQGA